MPSLTTSSITINQIIDLDTLKFEWDALDAMPLEMFNELKKCIAKMKKLKL